jgi:hypothetical protein
MIKLLQKRSEVLELNFLLCKEIVLFHQMLSFCELRLLRKCNFSNTMIIGNER